MANFDLVEKLRERANVTYEEARAALDACNDDLLDALIYLEKQGKVASPDGGNYSSKGESGAEKTVKIDPPKETRGETFGQLVSRFFGWCGRIVNKGSTNYFEVWRKNKKVMTVPVIILILLLIFAFWVTLPLIVIGLFFNYRYYFRGEQVEKIDINGVMDSAADAAENLKNEVKNVQQNDKK